MQGDMASDDVLFFAEPRAWRRWLEEHHQEAREVWVGFHKKGSGKPSITWPEAVDEALCFGWIDGIRKSIDEARYKNRFTPRKPRSTWSSVNVKRVKELSELGLMHPAGLEAFERRTPERSGLYSYGQRHGVRLDPAYEKRLRANRKAWEFFHSQPASYRQGAKWWVMSGKQEATRLRRLARLIDDSAHGRTVPPLTRRPK
jgi:uncharacterized protein YdeI (YjbR/CyaY-like superfamily)